MKLEFSKVYEWSRYFERAGSKDEDVALIDALYVQARTYIGSFQWCHTIIEEYVGFVYLGIVAVFLFKIQPEREGVDDWVWAIVGDLPPAYITCEDSPNPASALDAYIGAMEEWVKAAANGSDVKALIPVNVEPTKENSELLGQRLKFLDNQILSGYKDDLILPRPIQ